MSAGLAALLVGVLRLLVTLFVPPKNETACAVSDPEAIDPTVLARPDRLDGLVGPSSPAKLY